MIGGLLAMKEEEHETAQLKICDCRAFRREHEMGQQQIGDNLAVPLKKIETAENNSKDEPKKIQRYAAIRYVLV